MFGINASFLRHIMKFESNSAIEATFGVYGLVACLLIHPAWRPETEL